MWTVPPAVTKGLLLSPVPDVPKSSSRPQGKKVRTLYISCTSLAYLKGLGTIPKEYSLKLTAAVAGNTLDGNSDIQKILIFCEQIKAVFLDDMHRKIDSGILST